MARFYVIAALLVVAIGSIVFAHRIATLRDFRVNGRPHPKQTPTITRAAGPGGASATTFSGQGAWVMSALPACFDERRSLEGPAALLASMVPPASARLAPGTRLHAGPCTLDVGSDDVRITRGRDRLRIPPDARLYRRSDGLVLVWNGAGHTQIRIYAPAQESPWGDPSNAPR